jgi:hypothetical protein
MAIAIGAGAAIGLAEVIEIIATAIGVTAVAGGAAYSLSKASSTVDAAPTTTDCKDKPCDPCPPNFCQPDPPEPQRIDRVPPSTPHYPCPGDHMHTYWWDVNQNPKTCKCFCNKRERVDCLS